MSKQTNESIAERAIKAHHSYKQTQSEDTAREYRRHIRRFHKYLNKNTDVTLWDCHSGHAEDYYQWMFDDGYAPSSIRVAHASLGDFYKQIDKFEGRRGFPEVSVEQDPTEYASPERLNGMHTESKKDAEGGDKPLTKSEVRKLVDNVPAPTTRNELIVRLLYQTGMRRSELVRVKLDKIDRDNREITVYGKKTDESRKVWYQASLDTLLNLWTNGDRKAKLTADESPYLFCTSRSERMDEQVVTDVVTTAAENAGIQETIYQNRQGQNINRIGAHTLRKTFGVHFINDGGDISFLMDILGHKNIETTKENYLKYSTKDLENSVRRHGPSL
ncbi:tyrosine-type recombinase/integrase [Natrinema altunense]|uniref:Integrase n=1 Tax=Natrinema altunense TaxID=222984 RepID=A0A482XWA7_9EURY|nr:tyrosine-type recombinase/integrase [Natrinema altunense]RZH67362.1 hypothetical protein ELS17_10825 [Natrinema altunense]